MNKNMLRHNISLFYIQFGSVLAEYSDFCTHFFPYISLQTNCVQCFSITALFCVLYQILFLTVT